MRSFQSWFEDRGVYLLPDGTPVVARYCDLNDHPRWWFVQTEPDGRLGQLLAAVQPNGTVWNYVPGAEHAVRHPQRSDLMIADLRRAAHNWAERVGIALALLWVSDGLGDMLSASWAFAL